MEKKTISFGMRFTLAERRKIQRLAERQRATAKQAVLNAVELALQENQNDTLASGAFLEGIEHLAGSVTGPGDLLTNSKYMADFGRSRSDNQRS